MTNIFRLKLVFLFIVTVLLYFGVEMGFKESGVTHFNNTVVAKSLLISEIAETTPALESDSELFPRYVSPKFTPNAIPQLEKFAKMCKEANFMHKRSEGTICDCLPLTLGKYASNCMMSCSCVFLAI